MNGFQSRKGQDLQKPFPGCMGRMINIFDLSTGMPRTKLLTEKPHQDVSPVHTNRPDVVNKKTLDNFGVQEDKTITGRKHLSKKSGGTPMKILIAQEMSREPQSDQKPSNVVVKLMGLDTLPVQQSALTAKRGLPEGYSHKSPSGEFQGHWQQEDSSYHKTLQSDTKYCACDNDFKDVHEIWQQPSRNTHFKDKPPRNRRHEENPIERRMALVHQKFTEAKRLATEEKLLQSQEFQEALEVLSSNRDLFLKFLEEPNALFSKYLPESQNISPASQTRRITVLKPSKTMEPKGEAQERELLHPAVDVERDINLNWRSSRSPSFVHYKAENISHPARIVVLKPNPGMSHEMKARVASPVTSKRLEGRECYGSLEPNEATEPREIAKEITRQMQEHMRSNQKDEIAISSTLSNGYVGDESSFTRSENDYINEECDNASDSESVTPTSRHSWDYSFRLGSPFSISSFSRAGHSPEPSVIKEAKKRLSERLAMVSSNGINQEQSQLRRSSSTLGEMLAIAEVMKEEGADNLTISSRRSFGGEQEQQALTSCLSVDGMKEECSEDSHRNLARSKSVPVSSPVYEHSGLREEVPDSMICKSIVQKEVVAKSKSGMSSFTGKVSSLFLSRIKKAGREKPPIPSCFLGSNHSETNGTNRNGASLESFRCCHSEESILVNSEGKTGKASSSSTSLKGPKQGTSIPKRECWPPQGSPSSEKSRAYENPRENQDQPSPISVLEAPFDDDANSSICLPSASIISGHPQALSRSPPIGSISRTLTRENPREIPHQSTLKLSRVLSRECEEQERFLLVQKLLSCANLLDNAECSTVLARWHSLDSPLDPILLDEFLDRKEEAAKCRERRSNQRLVFDCVNAALLSIGQTTLASSYPWATAYGWASKDQRTCSSVVEEVLRLVKDWFSSERHMSGEVENQNLAVAKLVKREGAGSGWTESMCMEVDEFSREIGVEVLEELVEEALTDLTDGCL